jgi:hypothetical protein
MHWLFENINHFTVPLGIALGLMSVIVGMTAQRKRKAGIPPPYLSRRVTITMYVVVSVCLVLLGIVLVRNFG